MNNSMTADRIVIDTDAERSHRKILAALVLGPYGDGEGIPMVYDYAGALRGKPSPSRISPGADQWDVRFRRAHGALITARESTVSDLRDKGIISARKAEALLRCPTADERVTRSTAEETRPTCGDIALCPYCYARAVYKEMERLEIFSPASAGKVVYFFDAISMTEKRVRKDQLSSFRDFTLTQIAANRPRGAKHGLVCSSAFPIYETCCPSVLRVAGVMAPIADEGNELPRSTMELEWCKVAYGDRRELCAKLSGSLNYPAYVFFPSDVRMDMPVGWAKMARLMRKVNIVEVLDMDSIEPYRPNLAGILSRLCSQENLYEQEGE
jgi:hypothetical protein